MINQSVSFVGRDLGIIIGVLENVMTKGIMVYKPINDFHPNTDTTPEELYDNLPSTPDYALVPYESVRLIHVNKKCVFKNRDNIDRAFHGIKPDNPEYSGRGDLEILVDLNKLSIIDLCLISNFKGLVLKKDSPSFFIEIPKDFDRSLLGSE
jgi:hypothetical protein